MQSCPWPHNIPNSITLLWDLTVFAMHTCSCMENVVHKLRRRQICRLPLLFIIIVHSDFPNKVYRKRLHSFRSPSPWPWNGAKSNAYVDFIWTWQCLRCIQVHNKADSLARIEGNLYLTLLSSFLIDLVLMVIKSEVRFAHNIRIKLPVKGRICFTDMPTGHEMAQTALDYIGT